MDFATNELVLQVSGGTCYKVYLQYQRPLSFSGDKDLRNGDDSLDSKIC